MPIKDIINKILRSKARDTAALGEAGQFKAELSEMEQTSEMKGKAKEAEEPPKQVALHPVKVLVEFFCQMCDHYIYAKLNTSLDGNHIVVCPKCGHEHYRVVKNGIITEDRYDPRVAVAEELHFTKSAAVPKSERRQYGNIARIREAEASGHHT